MNYTHVLIPELPTYVSRVLPLSASAAPSVFEQWWADARRSSNGARVETVGVPHGHLALDGASWARCSPGPFAPYRRVRGRLRVRGRRPWPVELELSPWSASSSELGVRYTGRRRPGSAQLDRYHRMAIAVLDAVEARLLDAAPVANDVRIRRPDAA